MVFIWFWLGGVLTHTVENQMRALVPRKAPRSTTKHHKTSRPLVNMRGSPIGSKDQTESTWPHYTV